jgi:hypothetical protein
VTVNHLPPPKRIQSSPASNGGPPESHRPGTDLIAVTAPGRFGEVWGKRRRLAGDALITWESRSTADLDARWFKWLTRDIVKVECGVVDASAANMELAEPFAVLVGDASVTDRFPRISPSVLEQRHALLAEQQKVFDPDDMTDGERIDWKISEMKNTVRAALRHQHSA